jgi:hypothetical protein
VITVISTDHAPVEFEVRVAGLALYLDNFALIELAKPQHDERRRRLLAALKKSNGSLLFSATNGAELAALTGTSASNVRAFLNDFGSRWAFVEMNPATIIAREAEGRRDDASLSRDLVHAFFQDRQAELSRAGAIVDMSADNFFQLGAVMDWLGAQGAEHARKRRNPRQDGHRSRRPAQSRVRKGSEATRRPPAAGAV